MSSPSTLTFTKFLYFYACLHRIRKWCWLPQITQHQKVLKCPTPTFHLIYRQQMQPVIGPSSPSCSSTSDCFPLSHLNTVECGSETSAEQEKHEVRANKPVSIRQRFTIVDWVQAITPAWCGVKLCWVGSVVSVTAAVGEVRHATMEHISNLISSL